MIISSSFTVISSPTASIGFATRDILTYEKRAFSSYGMPFPAALLLIPEEVQNLTKEYIKKGADKENAWTKLFAKYEKKYPELAKEYKQWMSKEKIDLVGNADLWEYPKDDASRGYGSTILNKLAKLIPNLMGGSADLGPSNKTIIKSSGDFLPTKRDGNNMHFGIREHAMGAIANGMYLHGGILPCCQPSSYSPTT